MKRKEVLEILADFDAFINQHIGQRLDIQVVGKWQASYNAMREALKLPESDPIGDPVDSE